VAVTSARPYENHLHSLQTGNHTSTVGWATGKN